MSYNPTSDARFIFLQNQIRRKLKAKTLILSNKISPIQFNQVNTFNDDTISVDVAQKIKELNTVVDVEDFYHLATSDTCQAIMCPENFEAFIYDTFIPALEEQADPDVSLPNDLIMLW
ncbi:hypothetical protein CANMA_004340 [Candida margitis]|uniref:uncharacterized protein n=1 Tax=Candida margitis TaxID=1775924 RepID=UPI0022273F80|nr:uncharacterized protein CANMA_004340 [Candida margitis]KAI5957908.1 hypothetical protein CANMA_004340 [Candida margitis]